MKREDWKELQTMTGFDLSWKGIAVGIIIYLLMLAAVGIGQIFGY